jgi:hypothetical protein
MLVAYTLGLMMLTMTVDIDATTTICYTAASILMLTIAATTTTSPIIAWPQTHTSNVLQNILRCVIIFIPVLIYAVLATNGHTAFTTGGFLPNLQSSVCVDSGCTKTVFCNSRKLINLRDPTQQINIAGVGGNITVEKIGDFPVALKDKDGITHCRLIKDCLYSQHAQRP